MKKIFIITITLLLTTACSYSELKDIGIIDTLAIDKIDNAYQITVNIKEIVDNQITTNTYSTTSNNLFLALSNLHQTVNKDINYSHIEVLLLGKSITINDLAQIIEVTKENTEFRNNFTVLYTENIKEIIDTKIEGSSIIKQINLNKKELSNTSIITYNQLLKNYLEDKTILIPSITKIDNIKIEPYIILNSKIILTNKESLIYNYLTNKVEKHPLTIDNLNLQITSSKTKIKKINNTAKIEIESTIQVISNPNNYTKTKIKELYQNNIKDEIYKTLSAHNSIDLLNIKNKKVEYKINIKGVINE